MAVDVIRAIARTLPLPAAGKLVVQPGELLPSHQAGRPLFTSWSLADAIENGYKDSAIVFVAASAGALAAASVPWIAEIRTRGGDWQPAPGHPIEELIKRPNSRTSSQELHERLVLHLNLAGNGLIKKVVLGRSLPGALAPVVSELWNLSPEGVQPIPDKVEFISGYQFTRGHRKKVIAADEIVHFMFQDPGNPFWGLSPLEAISKVVDTNREGTAWNMLSMQNRAIADGVFVSTAPMTKEQWEDYREMVFEQHQGAKNAHQPWVLGGGFDWKEMSRTPVEMDFIESAKFNREMILSGYHVPPVMAGFFDQATLANADVSRRLFWVDYIVPFLDRLENVWNRSLVPHFGDPTTLRVQADTSDVDALRENTLEQTRIFMMLTKAGVPYNEASTKSGLSLVSQDPEGDEPFGIVSPTAGGGGFGAAGLLPDTETKLLTDSDGYPPPEPLDAKALGLTGAQLKQASALALDLVQAIPEHQRQIEARFAKETAAHRRRGVRTAALVAALEARDPGAFELALDMPGYERRLTSLAEEIGDAVVAGAAIAAASLLEQTGVDFDVGSAATRAFIRSRAVALAAGLVKGSTEGVRKLYQKWVAGELGESAARAAKVIKDAFSLAARDAGAVGKFYSTLLERAEFGAAEVARRSARLAKGYENARKALIGHQEATKALHDGQRRLWNNAVSDGRVGTAKKTWLDSGMPNRDPICISLHGQTVNIDENYIAPYDGVEYSGPGDPHANCNCGELYVATTL